ncbi:hypothetical protein BDC45DRAFT_508539, partial [Circinella umbellata]
MADNNDFATGFGVVDNNDNVVIVDIEYYYYCDSVVGVAYVEEREYYCCWCFCFPLSFFYYYKMIYL